MTPILFLDVDGVLNNRTTLRSVGNVRECVLRPVMNPGLAFTGVVENDKVAAVRRVVEACRAKIVVSSSWRDAFTDAAAFAAAIGIVPPLKDAPDLFHKDWRTDKKLSSYRCNEIDWWLKDHRMKKGSYAILDDYDCVPASYDMDMHMRLVQTDEDVGVTNVELNIVAALLGGPQREDWFAPERAEQSV